MNPSFEQTTLRAVEICHSNGVEMFLWVWAQSPQEELDEVERLVTLAEPVDGVITNQPEKAVKIPSI